jgi:hypothetical protein
MMFIDSYGDGYFFTGSKYLKYISSITVIHNDNIIEISSILMNRQANAQLGMIHSITGKIYT